MVRWALDPRCIRRLDSNFIWRPSGRAQSKGHTQSKGSGNGTIPVIPVPGQAGGCIYYWHHKVSLGIWWKWLTPRQEETPVCTQIEGRSDRLNQNCVPRYYILSVTTSIIGIATIAIVICGVDFNEPHVVTVGDSPTHSLPIMLPNTHIVSR